MDLVRVRSEEDAAGGSATSISLDSFRSWWTVRLVDGCSVGVVVVEFVVALEGFGGVGVVPFSGSPRTSRSPPCSFVGSAIISSGASGLGCGSDGVKLGAGREERALTASG